MKKHYPRLSALVFFVTAASCVKEPKNPIATQPLEPKLVTSQPEISKTNDVRNKIGIRPIGDNWILYRSNAESESWKIPGSDFIAKVVLRDASGSLTTEDDYYYSGEKFTDSEGTTEELITVRYDYRINKIAVFYLGANATTASILRPFLFSEHGFTTYESGFSANISGALDAVEKATKTWPKP